MTERTLLALITQNIHSLAPVLMERTDRGWKGLSWRQFGSHIQNAIEELQGSGVKKGDRVAIYLPNVFSWEVYQFAAFACGAVVIGIDTRETGSQAAQKLAISGARYLITNRSLSENLNTPVSFILPKEVGNLVSRSSLVFGESIGPEDLALGVFTSGTTAEPKLYYFTHGQVAATIEALLPSLGVLKPPINQLCWLPLANLFQRILNYCTLQLGGTIFLHDDPSTLMEVLPEVKIEWIAGVPRLYEKVAAGISQSLNANLLSMTLLRLAKIFPNGPFRNLLGMAVRKKFGGRLKYLVSGSAPLPFSVVQTLTAVGFQVVNCYGVSENIFPNAINMTGQCPDSVGKALYPNDICLNGEGEILVRGPGLSRSTPVDDKGYYHTADEGYFNDRGFLYITGRRDDLIKTSTGRKINPLLIEQKLREVCYVEQAVVVGAGQKIPIAILDLSIPYPGLDKVRLHRELKDICDTIASPDRPAAFILSEGRIGVKTQLLTANLKLKRKEIIRVYAQEIATAYCLIDTEKEQFPFIIESPVDRRVA